jgi:thiol-disulfide isomerase/thioredoxin/Tfp pilus assembly protein PilF
MNRASRACGIFVLVACSAFAQGAQTEAEALAEVHALLRGGDSYGAGRRMAELVPLHPSSVELRAMWIASLSTRQRERAWDLAQQLRHAHPRNPWSWYAVAQAGFLNSTAERTREALDALGKMESLAPAPLPDAMLRLKSSFLGALGRQGEMTAQLAERDDPLALYLKARNLEATVETNSKAYEEAAVLYARALEAAPDDVRVAVSHLHALISTKAPDALETGRKLVERAPLSSSAHEMYWIAIHRSALTMEEKKAFIADDIARLTALRDTPETLRSASSIWRRLDDREREAEANRELVRRFPDTLEAQGAMFNLMFRERWTPSGEPGALAERRQTIQRFIDYPYHWSRDLLAQAYSFLLSVNRLDPAADDAELLRAVDGLVAYASWPEAKTAAASALAERGLRLEEAEKLAREGLSESMRMYDLEKASFENYEEAMRTVRGEGRTVVGLVLMKRNKMTEAGKELQLAAKERPNSGPVNFNLGTWQERKGELSAAEATYARGMAHENKADPKNLNALRALYKRRKGSEAGFEEYAANLRLAGSSDEKRAVMATRLIPAKPLVRPFALKDLDGNLVSLDDVKGQIAVVNLWGIWCGPCVAEMPELQKLHDKYANDPKVRILTINNDVDPAKVAPWMKKNGYSLPVLLGRSWVEAQGPRGFPTTYFIQPDGVVAFVKTGSIGNLMEEFSWRIEAMRTKD